jgi:hypothetical protein
VRGDGRFERGQHLRRALVAPRLVDVDARDRFEARDAQIERRALLHAALAQ